MDARHAYGFDSACGAGPQPYGALTSLREICAVQIDDRRAPHNPLDHIVPKVESDDSDDDGRRDGALAYGRPGGGQQGMRPPAAFADPHAALWALPGGSGAHELEARLAWPDADASAARSALGVDGGADASDGAPPGMAADGSAERLLAAPASLLSAAPLGTALAMCAWPLGGSDAQPLPGGAAKRRKGAKGSGVDGAGAPASAKLRRSRAKALVAPPLGAQPPQPTLVASYPADHAQRCASAAAGDASMLQPFAIPTPSRMPPPEQMAHLLPQQPTAAPAGSAAAVGAARAGGLTFGGGGDDGGSASEPEDMGPVEDLVSFERVAETFDMPIEEAARVLSVCTSIVKRVCRTHGIMRWPYRKISSISRSISQLELLLANASGPKRAHYERDLALLRARLGQILSGGGSAGAGPSGEGGATGAADGRATAGGADGAAPAKVARLQAASPAAEPALSVVDGAAAVIAYPLGSTTPFTGLTSTHLTLP